MWEDIRLCDVRAQKNHEYNLEVRLTSEVPYAISMQGTWTTMLAIYSYINCIVAEETDINQVSVSNSGMFSI